MLGVSFLPSPCVLCPSIPALLQCLLPLYCSSVLALLAVELVGLLTEVCQDYDLRSWRELLQAMELSSTGLCSNTARLETKRSETSGAQLDSGMRRHSRRGQKRGEAAEKPDCVGPLAVTENSV